MRNEQYLTLLLFHIGLGVILAVLPSLSRIYLYPAIAYWLYLIIANSDRDNQALLAAAYFTGAEVLFRSTGAVPLYEFVKYAVIGFLLIGLLYRGLRRNNSIYLVYILLLFPAVIIGAYTIEDPAAIRKSITFNLSGPVALGIAALYCSGRKMSAWQTDRVLVMLCLPIAMMCVYLMIFTPSLEDSVTGTSANFAASGGFGPNQVSTIMGLGAFLFFVRFSQNQQLNLIKILDGIFLLLCAFRGLATFSRGGMLVAAIMISLFLGTHWFFSVRSRAQLSSARPLVFLAVGVVVVWAYTSVATGGLLDNRYLNKNAAGVVKSDITTGRAQLLDTEIAAFMSEPFWGVGAGVIKQYRQENFGVNAASHNEVSRLLSEHGSFGIAILLLLLFIPLSRRLQGETNPYFYAFFFFYFATINHSSMRLAAPAVVYGLCLLHETNPLRGERPEDDDAHDDALAIDSPA